MQKVEAELDRRDGTERDGGKLRAFPAEFIEPAGKSPLMLDITSNNSRGGEPPSEREKGICGLREGELLACEVLVKRVKPDEKKGKTGRT